MFFTVATTGQARPVLSQKILEFFEISTNLPLFLMLASKVITGVNKVTSSRAQPNDQRFKSLVLSLLG